MNNVWNATKEEKEKWIPIIENWINGIKDKVELTRDDCINFYNTGMSIAKVEDILKEIGYENINFDCNGCECDYWITFQKNEPTGNEVIDKLKLAGAVYTNEMILRSVCN